jgi:hypothetical protein
MTAGDISGSGVLEALITVGAGIALAAASGLRIFVPLLAVSIANVTGHLALAPGTAWIGTIPALVAFGVAAALEITGYFFPALDHALDALGSPLAIVAGILASASLLVDFPPLLRWVIAVIGGGGVAGFLHGATALVRLKSTGLTAGIGNPVIAVSELAGSLVLTILSLLVPVAAVILASIIGVALIRRRRRQLAQRGQQS